MAINTCMEQQELFEQDTTAYVYESPDGGKTIYRRRLMDPHYKRELIIELDDEYKDYRDWMYKQDWSTLSQKPAIKEALDRLRVIVELIKE